MYAAAASAKSLQSCPTLHDPMDCSPPGSSVHGIFQARVLEWVAIAFSRIHVYLWLIHVDVCRNQHNIIKQLSFNFKKTRIPSWAVLPRKSSENTDTP